MGEAIFERGGAVVRFSSIAEKVGAFLAAYPALRESGYSVYAGVRIQDMMFGGARLNGSGG